MNNEKLLNLVVNVFGACFFIGFFGTLLYLVIFKGFNGESLYSLIKGGIL